MVIITDVIVVILETGDTFADSLPRADKEVLSKEFWLPVPAHHYCCGPWESPGPQGLRAQPNEQV